MSPSSVKGRHVYRHFKRFRFPRSLVFLSCDTTHYKYRCYLTLFTVLCGIWGSHSWHKKMLITLTTTPGMSNKVICLWLRSLVSLPVFMNLAGWLVSFTSRIKSQSLHSSWHNLVNFDECIESCCHHHKSGHTTFLSSSDVPLCPLTSIPLPHLSPRQPLIGFLSP